MKRLVLVLTVALVMAVMFLAMAMPAFARAANPCETGDTPSSPPDVGAAPPSPPAEAPPGTAVREPQPIQSRGHTPFTGPDEPGRCDNSL